MISIIAQLSAWFALGGAAGACHFLLLRRSVGLLLGKGRLVTALALHLGRIALTLIALGLAARGGWAALLACTAGVLAARQVVVRRSGAADA